MLVNKEIDVPATKRIVVDKVVCDMCKTVFPLAWANTEKIEWSTGWRTEATGVFIQKGSVGDGEGCVTTTAAHICTECFNTKLIPWLQEQGVELTESECDW